MATITPLADALANGTYALLDIIFVLSQMGELDANQGTIETEAGDLYVSKSGDQIESFTLFYDNVQVLSVTGLSISYSGMQAAVLAANGGEGDNSGIYDLFSGIDYIGDFVDLEAPVFAVYGLGGDDEFRLTEFADTYSFDGGDDLVLLGGGDDLIAGWIGVAASGTSVINGGTGTDTFGMNGLELGQAVDLTKKFTIDTGLVDIRIQLKNVENVTGTGFADRLAGTTAANVIIGGGGDDVINGRRGADMLTGGIGLDDFIYTSPKDTGRGANADVITDFASGIDDINLAALDPNTRNHKFVFIGDDNFSKKAGQLNFLQHDEFGTEDDYTLIRGDLNGDKKVDFEIRLTGVIDLAKADFML